MTQCCLPLLGTLSLGCHRKCGCVMFNAPRHFCYWLCTHLARFFRHTFSLNKGSISLSFLRPRSHKILCNLTTSVLFQVGIDYKSYFLGLSIQCLRTKQRLLGRSWLKFDEALTSSNIFLCQFLIKLYLKRYYNVFSWKIPSMMIPTRYLRC